MAPAVRSLAFAVLIASAQGTVPKGLTTFFDAEACPTGWSELATSKGRLVVSVAEGSHAGITVNSPINGTQEPTHTHSYSAQASLPEKDVAAIDCCNDQGAHHGDYKVAGNLNPSASGHPFVTMVLCTIAEEDTGGSVPFGTIAYFDPIVETCPSGWGSVESLKGRVIVPAYTSAGGQRFSSNQVALSSGEDRKHAQYSGLLDPARSPQVRFRRLQLAAEAYRTVAASMAQGLAVAECKPTNADFRKCMWGVPRPPRHHPSPGRTVSHPATPQEKPASTQFLKRINVGAMAAHGSQWQDCGSGIFTACISTTFCGPLMTWMPVMLFVLSKPLNFWTGNPSSVNVWLSMIILANFFQTVTSTWLTGASDSQSWTVSHTPGAYSGCSSYDICDPYHAIDGGANKNFVFNGMSGPPYKFDINFGYPLVISSYRVMSSQPNWGFEHAKLQLSDDSGATYTDIASSEVTWPQNLDSDGFTQSGSFSPVAAQYVRFYMEDKLYSSYGSSRFQLYLKEIQFQPSVAEKGFTGPDGTTPSACTAGMFKNVTGSASCTPCPANSATGGSTGSSAATACVANAGYTGPDGSTPTACLADTFKAGNGSAGCTSCPCSSASGPSSTSQTSCACKPGHVRSLLGLLDACPPGYTAPPGGSFGGQVCCMKCGPTLYQNQQGSVNDCKKCPRYSTSDEGSDSESDCTCDPGFTGPDGGPCQHCSFTTFKAMQGSALCEACPANSGNIASVTVAEGQCLCSPGYTNSSSGCVKCSPGQFKTLHSSAACSPCPPGTYIPEALQISSMCLTADPGFMQKTDQSGQEECEPGTFSSSGSVNCSMCPEGEFAPSGASSCAPCLAGTVPNGDASRCQRCSAGKSTAQSLTACSSCANGTVSQAGASECVQCLARSQSNEDQTFCDPCQQGFSSVAGGVCQSVFAPVIFIVNPSQFSPERTHAVSIAGSSFPIGSQCLLKSSERNWTLSATLKNDAFLTCDFDSAELRGYLNPSADNAITMMLAVLTELGLESNNLPVVLYKPPQLLNISVTSGQAGDRVVISGTKIPDILSDTSVVRCKFGEADAEATLLGAGRLSCLAPAQLQMKSYEVQVSLNTLDRYDGWPNAVTFNYFGLTGIGQKFVSNQGGATITLTIDGETNTLQQLRCVFGDESLGHTTVVERDGAIFACDVPSATSLVGEVPVRLTNNNGTTFGAGDKILTLFDPPSITNLQPDAGPSSGNSTITISGDGFGQYINLQQSHCSFGAGTKASPAIVLSNNSIICVTPAMPKGVYTVELSLNNGLEKWPAGSFTFEPCSAGSSSENFDQPCQDCIPSQFQPKADSRRCFDCNSRQFSNTFGSTQCELCPNSSAIPGEPSHRNDSTKCECIKSFYVPCPVSERAFVLDAGQVNDSITLQTTLRGQACVSCPIGATCAGGWEQPRPLLGFWLESNDPRLTIYQCPEPEQCTASWRPCAPQDHCNSSVGPFTTCREGARGRMCGTCAAGFYKDNGLCLVCKENSSTQFIALLLMMVVALFCILGVGWRLSEFLPPQVYGTIGVLIAFCQTVAIMRRIRMNWPRSLLITFKVFSVALFELSLFRFDCVISDVSQLTKSILFLSAPVVIFMLLCGVRGIQLACTKSERKHKMVISVSRLAISTFNLICFPVCEALIGLTKCTWQVRAKLYVLEADPSVVCFQGDWLTQHLVVFIVGVTVYCIVPVTVNVVIIFNKAKLVNQDSLVFKSLSGYFFKYHNGAPFHENVVLLRKIALASSAALITNHPSQTMICIMVVLLAAWLYQRDQHPSQTAENNEVETISLAVLSVLVTASALLYMPQPDAMQSADDNSMWPYVAGVLISFVLYAFVVLALALIALQFATFQCEREWMSLSSRDNFFNRDALDILDLRVRSEAPVRKAFEEFADQVLTVAQSREDLATYMQSGFNVKVSPLGYVPTKRRTSNVLLSTDEKLDVVDTLGYAFSELFLWTHRMRYYSQSRLGRVWLGCKMLRCWFGPSETTVGMLSMRTLLNSEPFVSDDPTFSCLSAAAFWIDNVASKLERDLVLMTLQAWHGALNGRCVPAGVGDMGTGIAFSGSSIDGRASSNDGLELVENPIFTNSRRSVGALFDDETNDGIGRGTGGLPPLELPPASLDVTQ